MRNRKGEHRLLIGLMRGLSILASSLLLLGRTRLVLAQEAAAPDSQLTNEISIMETKTEKAFSGSTELDGSVPASEDPEPTPESVFHLHQS